MPWIQQQRDAQAQATFGSSSNPYGNRGSGDQRQQFTQQVGLPGATTFDPLLGYHTQRILDPNDPYNQWVAQQRAMQQASVADAAAKAQAAVQQQAQQQAQSRANQWQQWQQQQAQLQAANGNPAAIPGTISENARQAQAVIGQQPAVARNRQDDDLIRQRQARLIW